MPGGGDDAHADGNADGRQHQGVREDRTHRGPARRQPALGQDHRQRNQAEVRGELVVGELDAEPGLADRQPDRQVDEQDRQSRAVREPHRDDADEQQAAGDEQDQVDALVHRLASRPRCFSPRPRAR